MQFTPSLRYEHPGLGDDREMVDHKAKAKMAYAKWAGDMLNRYYPGHAWHVEVQMAQNSTGGVIKIRLNGIMPAERWYVINMRDILTDGDAKRLITRAGGELLERYGLRRGAFSLDDWRLALNAMPLSRKLTGRGHLAPLLD